MISVETTITRADVRKGSLASLWRVREFWTSWAMWTVVIGAVIAVANGAPKTPRNWLVLIFAAVVGALASQLVVLALSFWRGVWSLNEADGVLGQHLYQLREDGLFEKTTANETLASWNSVTSLRRARGYIFIEVPRGAFHFIPERSFVTAADADEFWAELKRYAHRAT